MEKIPASEEERKKEQNLLIHRELARQDRNALLNEGIRELLDDDAARAHQIICEYLRIDESTSRLVARGQLSSRVGLVVSWDALSAEIQGYIQEHERSKQEKESRVPWHIATQALIRIERKVKDGLAINTAYESIRPAKIALDHAKEFVRKKGKDKAEALVRIAKDVFGVAISPTTAEGQISRERKTLKPPK